VRPAPRPRAWTRRWLKLGTNADLSEAGIVGETPSGEAIDLSLIILATSRDGLFTSFEYFPPERLDDALARFEGVSGSLDHDE
jgi:hypothetical protein